MEANNTISYAHKGPEVHRGLMATHDVRLEGVTMARHTSKNNAGMTLVEVALAMAVFAIVLGAMAQVLISYHTAMDMQSRRTRASQACRAILSEMRTVRNANPNNFPGSVTERWPDGHEFESDELPGYTIGIDYADPNANPLAVTVSTEWQDLRGRTIVSAVDTLLTDR